MTFPFQNIPEKSFFIFLNKPKGITSQQCLTQFKSQNSCNKVGHHGTLDPFASGLLLVGVNEATKFFQFVDDSKKTYEATLYLGVKTDTLDETGQVVSRQDVPLLSVDEIQQKTKSLVGKIMQMPPMYSAVKINGERLYKLARQGIEVERAPREVEIFELQICEWQSPYLKIRTTVSRGTYVRVLAEQIAELLGTCAHLTQLSRTGLCGFDLAACDRPLQILELLNSYPKIILDDQQKRDIMCGQKISVSAECLSASFSRYVLATHHHQFLGVLEKQGDFLASARLINTADL